MESESNGDNMNTNSWSSATSWTIASGNLLDSLTFESSTSPIDDDDDDDKINDLNFTTKTPIVLQPPVPDSAPCEITLNFTQKHEVQQIYVRSTARVYEIYYAPNFQSGNEYLCTVRCGIAARDEQVLHTTDNEEVLSACSKGSENNQSKESSRTNSNLSTSEDDWVEVKVPNTSVLGNKENSSPLKFCSAQERSTQDFYEATAQITDANPCVSLTLRLLSLQCKERVYVDEIYVFADPVDSNDSENQVGQVENSTGSSLVTMLLPTLLQLSKTKGATQSQEKQTSETWKKQNLQGVGSEATDSTTIVTKVQEPEKPYVSDSTTITSKVQQEEKPSISDHQEVEFQDFNSESVGTAQLQNPSQVPLSQPDFPPNNHVERSLDQLFSRMGRIEDICSRLEENLLKPIYSIEARLQRVEQQLEVLTNKPKSYGFSSCSRFCAPNFSCIESDSISFCNSGGDYPHCEEFESSKKEGDNEEFGSNKKDIYSDTLSTPADDMSDSVKATDWLPSLVVTAPEFSNCDDEEENNASNGVMDSLEDKPRQALTIDDALASALAGFVSSVSIQSENIAQNLSVETPEVSNEEDGTVGKRASLKVQCEISTDRTESMDDSPPSNALNLSSLESEGIEVRCFNRENSDQIAGVDGQCLLYEGGEIDEPWGSHINNNDDQIQTHRGMVGTEETENEEVSSEIRNITVHDKTYIQSQILINQTDIDSNTILEDVTASTDSTAAAEVTDEGSDRDILRNMFEFSRAASVVDFEVPVLDVKFVSQDSCTGYIPLEALLSDLPKSKSESSLGEESVDVSPSGEHGSLIFVEDGESVGPATIDKFSVDLDYCCVQEPLSMKDETVLALSRNISSSHELSIASLI